MTGAGGIARAASHQRITQDKILEFDSVGQVTLLNFTDCHAQLMPLHFREPSVNIGVGKAKGKPPHITGKAMLERFGLRLGSARAHAFSSHDFVALSKEYGRVGGIAHMATLINAVRAERPGRTLLIDCGDTWQGSYTSLKTRGDDMVSVMNALGVDLMTAHWEFTYGADRVKELIEKLNFPFLAGNVKDNTWEEPVFDAITFFERGGVKIGVIGQAFPYTPIANPRYLIPDWSFGIDEDKMRDSVAKAKAGGAELVVLASHNGFDVDRKMAGRIDGIDVILTGHTHDAIPTIVKVGNTLMVAAGSHGKFLARLDLRIENKKITDFRFKMMPVFSDVVAADPKIAGVIRSVRAPFEKTLGRVLGRSEGLLYRRGNFNGTFDDLICDAVMKERDVEICLSPGFRWGATILPGQDIRVEDVYAQTAITYPNVYRRIMTGKRLKEILEDVGDNLFNVDPYLQQGGDMVRVGGMGYDFDVAKKIGGRVSNMTLLASAEPIDPSREYVVGGWASVIPDTEGPPIYDLVSRYIEAEKTINVKPNRAVRIRNT